MAVSPAVEPRTGAWRRLPGRPCTRRTSPPGGAAAAWRRAVPAPRPKTPTGRGNPAHPAPQPPQALPRPDVTRRSGLAPAWGRGNPVSWRSPAVVPAADRAAGSGRCTRRRWRWPWPPCWGTPARAGPAAVAAGGCRCRGGDALSGTARSCSASDLRTPAPPLPARFRTVAVDATAWCTSRPLLQRSGRWTPVYDAGSS